MKSSCPLMRPLMYGELQVSSASAIPHVRNAAPRTIARMFMAVPLLTSASLWSDGADIEDFRRVSSVRRAVSDAAFRGLRVEICSELHIGLTRTPPPLYCAPLRDGLLDGWQ